ncbi:MAG: hypothetical protein DRJ40_02580 [Thermoprotei archaeon]|nr:MAG: hypothetical protein DRJ40_02580 [Thermoprotei archaeon]
MSGLREEFLRLLREDVEFRYAVVGLLGIEEVLKRIDKNTEAIKSLQEQVRDLQKQVRDLQKQVAKHSEVIRSLQEQVRNLQEQMKVLQEQVRSLQEQALKHSRVLEEHMRVLERLVASIQALGLKYGLSTEGAFRESIKYLVEDLLKVYRVERWVYYDSEGVVFGYPSWIEVDLLIRDGEHVLVEYKASVDRADVAELYRVGVLYERVTGVKPKMLIVSPGIRKRAKELADKLGIECRGEVLEV